MTSSHAASSPPTLAALVAALAPALMLALAACNRPATTPTTDAAAPPATTAPAATSAPAPPATATPTTPTTPTTPAPIGTQLARYDGYGDLRLGMDVAAARQAWQGELDGPVDGDEPCYYLSPVSNPSPSYFAFMIENGKFVRYDVGNERELAPGGGKVGMSESDIEALYRGRVKASPHKYEPKGKYLRIQDSAGPGVLVFELDASGRVSRWRAGLPPQVDYVEGCS